MGCRSVHQAVQYVDDGPILYVVVAQGQIRLFDNFVEHVVSHTMGMPTTVVVKHLLVFSVDDASYLSCQHIASFHTRLKIDCIGALKTALDDDGDAGLCTGGCYYYYLNWLRVALAQLLLDIGAASLVWSDVDIVFRAPLLKQYFNPFSQKVQVECEHTRSPESAQLQYLSRNGIVFIAQSARQGLAEWMQHFSPPHGLQEFHALRYSPHLYRCLKVSHFSGLPMPEDVHKLSPGVVSIHFWITGRMWTTLPSEVTGHVEAKVHKMREFGVWKPRFV